MAELGSFQPDWIICTDPKQLRNADVRKYVSVNAQLLSRQQRGKKAAPKRLKEKIAGGNGGTTAAIKAGASRRRSANAAKTVDAQKCAEEIDRILKIDNDDLIVFSSTNRDSSPGSTIPSLTRTSTTDGDEVEKASTDSSGRRKPSIPSESSTVGDSVTPPTSLSSNSRSGTPPRGGPKTLLDSGLLDPFNTGIVPISRDMNDLLLHLMFIMVPSKGLCEEQPWHQFCPVISLWARTAVGPTALPEHYISVMAVLSSPMLQYAVCSLASAHAHFLKGHLSREFEATHAKNPSRHRKLLVDCYYYQGKTMEGLQKHLTGQNEFADLISVVSTMCLLATSVYFGHKDDIIIHINGIKNIISMRGGWEVVPYDVAQIYLTTIYMCCIWTITAPPPPLHPGTIPVSSEPIDIRLLDPQVNKAYLPLLGDRLLAAKGNFSFDDEMLEIFTRAQYITRYREFCLYHPNEVSHRQVELFTSRRLEFEYLLMRRLFTNSNINICDKQALPDPRQPPIQLALLIFSVTNLELLNPSAGPIRVLSRLLRDSLQQTQQSDLLAFWFPNWDILMWILLLGIHISVQPRERQWYLSRLGPLVRQMGLLTWEDTRAVLMGCFYIERTFGTSLELAWEEACVVGEMWFDQRQFLE